MMRVNPQKIKHCVTLKVLTVLVKSFSHLQFVTVFRKIEYQFSTMELERSVGINVALHWGLTFFLNLASSSSVFFLFFFFFFVDYLLECGSISQNMKIFDNPGNSGKSSAIPAFSGTFSTIQAMCQKPAFTADNRVCLNCRSIAETAGIVENFHILDMYGVRQYHLMMVQWNLTRGVFFDWWILGQPNLIFHPIKGMSSISPDEDKAIVLIFT